VNDETRYLTIDRWQTAQAYEEFRAKYGAEYRELDGACEELTSDERLVGQFEGV
jgi:hypothetical protein